MTSFGFSIIQTLVTGAGQALNVRRCVTCQETVSILNGSRQ